MKFGFLLQFHQKIICKLFKIFCNFLSIIALDRSPPSTSSLQGTCFCIFINQFSGNALRYLNPYTYTFDFDCIYTGKFFKMMPNLSKFHSGETFFAKLCEIYFLLSFHFDPIISAFSLFLYFD